MGTASAVFSFSLLLLLSSYGAADLPSEPSPRPPKKGFPARPPPYTLPPARRPAVCPRDAVKLVACAGLLNLGGITVGSAAGKRECCSLLRGLGSAEVAACLCVVAKESILGIVTEWSVAIGPVLSACNTKVPSGFKCA